MRPYQSPVGNVCQDITVHQAAKPLPLLAWLETTAVKVTHHQNLIHWYVSLLLTYVTVFQAITVQLAPTTQYPVRQVITVQ